MGDSLNSLRAFPADVRAGGYQLELVQRGESPSDFRPMPDVGRGVIEIRLHSNGEYRIFYAARFEEAVLRPALLREEDPRDAAGRHRSRKATVPSSAGKAEEMKAVKSSGNVFLDVGFTPAEARNLRMRSDMMTALRKFIEKEELTQAAAARRLKVTQPRISDLTRGKISRFSLDTLVNMLADAGVEVELRIKGLSKRVA